MMQSNLTRAWVLAGTVIMSACGEGPFRENPAPAAIAAKTMSPFEEERHHLIQSFQVAKDAYAAVSKRFDGVKEVLASAENPLPSFENPERISIDGVITNIEIKSRTSDMLLADIKSTLKLVNAPLNAHLLSGIGMEHCGHLLMYRGRKSADPHEARQLIAFNQTVEAMELDMELGNDILYFPAKWRSVTPERIEDMKRNLSDINSGLVNLGVAVSNLEAHAQEKGTEIQTTFLRLWDQSLMLSISEDRCRGEYERFKKIAAFTPAWPLAQPE